jgi:hypothetical protein
MLQLRALRKGANQRGQPAAEGVELDSQILSFSQDFLALLQRQFHLVYQLSFVIGDHEDRFCTPCAANNTDLYKQHL